MKKIVLLITSMLLFVCLVQSQTATHVLGKTTYIEVGTDYSATNTVETWMLFDAPKDEPLTQDYQVELDSVSGNHTNVAVSLYGRKFVGGTWVIIGSAVNWKGTTADTTIIMSNATANRYRQFKVGFVGTGNGVTKIDNQKFKIWLE